MDSKMMSPDNPGNVSPESSATKRALPQEKEPESPLASGLPSWNIEPPAVVVRKKVRAL